MPAVPKNISKKLRQLKEEFESSKQGLQKLRKKFADGMGKGLERKWVSKTIEAEAALREARIAAGVDPGKPEFTSVPTSDPRSNKVPPPPSRSCGKRKADADLDTEEALPKRSKHSTPAEETPKPAVKRTAKRKAADLHEEETAPSKKVKQESSRPVGLTNHKQACFSNVVIQTLAAATHDQDLDSLFGRPSTAETFGQTPASLRKLGKSSRLSTRQLGTEREKLRKAVKASAAAGETDKVSVTKYLRLLLQDMKSTKDATACPHLFQTMLSFGSLGREEMSGDSQEDCHEYFTTVLTALEADPLAHNATGVNALFELQTETHDVCKGDCGHQMSPEMGTNNYHSISVPLQMDGESLGLQSLIESSLQSESDRKCSGCKASTTRRMTTVRNAPEALVVKVDRLHFDEKKKGGLKSKVAIDFSSSDDLQVDGHQYELQAVMMHDGTTCQRGHYTIFRRDGNAWWLLNDEKVISVSQDQTKDGTKRGQSAMLLLKKISRA